MKSRIFPIMDSLPVGKENAISSEELVRQFDCGDKRILQKMIADERKNGAVILSTTSGGYYKSNKTEEIEEFVRTLEKRAKNTLAVLRSAKRYLKQNQNQLSMDEYINSR